MKITFTTRTLLDPKNNQDIIDYFNEQVGQFNFVFRRVYHAIRQGTLDDANRGNTAELRLSNYCTEVQKQFDVSKRTANSIIKQAKGRLEAIKELKEYEKSIVEAKITELIDKIKTLSLEVTVKKNQAGKGLLNAEGLAKLPDLKSRLFALKRDLQKKQSSLKRINDQINSGLYNLCYGTKKHHEKYMRTGLVEDKLVFMNQRDSQMSYVGSKEEFARNQQLQLFYDKNINQFFIKLRKDFDGNKELKGAARYVHGRCYFKHHKDKLLSALNNADSPLSYKLIRKPKGLYLYVTFVIDTKMKELHPAFGAIGIDMNEHHFSVSEINKQGTLTKVYDKPYRSKQGGKTLNDMRQFVHDVVTTAKEQDRMVVIENLDFANKKATASKSKLKHEKKYNHMLHSFAYSRFTDLIINACVRHRVRFKRVNPAWTSKIGATLYSDKMKLSVHQAASYVIGRKGLGILDKMPPQPKSDKTNTQQA